MLWGVLIGPVGNVFAHFTSVALLKVGDETNFQLSCARCSSVYKAYTVAGALVMLPFDIGRAAV